MSGVWDVITGESGEQAAETSLEAAQLAAAGQQAALEYMQETEALPQQFREEALTSLAGVFGLPGGEGTQQQFIEQAMASPIYQEMMAGIPAGEEAIMRHASATGGLRSGTTSENLARLTTETRGRALSQAYGQQLAGIQGIAGMPSSTQQIAQMMSAPSQTIAQGMVAGAQAEQAGAQALTSGLLAGAGAYLSDIRLKENIVYLGERNGHSWFQWDWKENDLGVEGSSEGVMAHLVYETNPEVISSDHGYILVDYDALGFEYKEVA